ncbi:MAG: sigma-70 family RNA polymerase sigma factor, partial [Verrucomicrobiaceae bacterium]
MTDPDSMDDAELLRRFAAERSEASFAVLARRHTGLVLDTALRITGSRPLAEDIMQTVFLQLARKAVGVAGSRTVAAWLHRAAVLESRAVLRAESRRRRHTTEAAAMAAESLLTSPAPDPRMMELLRSLDEALGSLPAMEREVLLRHYYERQPYHEACQWLGTSEAGARQLAARARRRLATWFRRRHGMEISSPGISTLLAGHFPPGSSLSNGLLAEVAARAAVMPAAPPAVFDPGKVFYFLSAMKIQAALCLLFGFLLTLSLDIGRERVAQTAAADDDDDDDDDD